jgi:hypothetical protein
MRGLKYRTQCWKGTIQGPFHQSLVAIGPVVSEEKIFMWISNRVLLSQSQPNFAEMILGWFPSKIVSGISDLWPLVEGPNRRTLFLKRTIQWLFHQNLVLIEQANSLSIETPLNIKWHSLSKYTFLVYIYYVSICILQWRFFFSL